MKNEILRKKLESELREWAKKIDRLPRGGRYFEQNVDDMNLPIILDNYDSEIYDDAEDYIYEFPCNDSDFLYLFDFNVPVIQLKKVFQ